MKKIGGIKKSGFTLIELLVVVFIIGVLATTVTIALISSQKKSDDAKRKTDVNSLRTAISQFYEDNGRYPRSSNSSNECGHTALCGLEKMPEITPYLSALPRDPRSKNPLLFNYGYGRRNVVEAIPPDVVNRDAYVIWVAFDLQISNTVLVVDSNTNTRIFACITGSNQNDFYPNSQPPPTCSF